jgi:hypothetical protein
MSLMREAEWAGRVAKWRGSGLSADRFAAGRGFSGSALRHWAARLAKPAGTAKPDAGEPAKIKIARVFARRSAPSAAITVEVSGARITVLPGFDRPTLRAILEILGAVTPTRPR